MGSVLAVLIGLSLGAITAGIGIFIVELIREKIAKGRVAKGLTNIKQN